MSVLAGHRARPNGWYGMIILIATEGALFGTFIGTYVYLSFHAPAWPPDGIAAPSVTAPTVLALVLVAATVPMALAARAGRRDAVAVALAWLALAFVVQAVYLGLQIHLYVDDLSRFRPQTDAYGSIYFALLGLHHVHVGVGLLLDLWLFLRLPQGMTPYRRTALSAIALYWYFVAVAGLAVTAVILSPAW
ncbi:MAG TPA: cytochrome c oxidase subunit 3 [Gaiellales bacterium]|jgi:heme/copper-type cytochrome/quinol oxidase subunit 3|nr:cytochrome c oxidase subunit 3 [Gaiellales bacterium]